MSPTELQSIKARQKATWESGDFGEIAKSIMPAAEDFMSRLPLKPGMRVLDVACGNGNLAVIAARKGCTTSGVDIASNLIAQAVRRAAEEKLDIGFIEGDAEDLPFPDESFDAVVSMYGAMFTPQPGMIASEMFRVAKPGGFVAMANWTPEGFIGKMFEVFKKHLPQAPNGIPSVMLWGHEPTVHERMNAYHEVRTERRVAVMSYPMTPAATVDFFRRYYGPTGRAFESLDAGGQQALRHDLVALQSMHNSAEFPGMTETRAEYLEVIATRA